MTFTEFLILLIEVALAILVIGGAVGWAAGMVIGNIHQARHHCDDCLLRNRLSPEAETVYSNTERNP